MAGEWDHGAALSRPVSFFGSVSQSRSLVGGLATRDVAVRPAEKTCNRRRWTEREREKEREIAWKAEGTREGEKRERERKRSLAYTVVRRVVGRGSGGRHCFRDIPMLFVFSRSRRFPFFLSLSRLASSSCLADDHGGERWRSIMHNRDR